MKNAVINKIGVISVVIALSMSMLTGCGNRAYRNSDEVTTEGAADNAGMVHLDSTEDVTAFIDEVYGGVAEDLLPMGMQTTELDLNDADAMKYNTGLTDLSGISGVYVSQSMIGSVAYSAVYIRTTDDADAILIRQQLMENIDPAKWVCVIAEKESAVIFGNDVFFVMGQQDTADEVMSKAIAAAQAKGMKVSDTVEKINPI